jgi:hypothetical protein
MFRPPMTRGRATWLAGVAGLLFALPLVGRAQDPGSHLGLTAVAAVGLHGGFAQMERHGDGQEFGALIDLGWMRGRGVRLQAEFSFLRSRLTESVLLEDSTFHGKYFDLSGGVSAIWLATPNGKVSPYALGGVAVHALSSTFGSPLLDARYNANRLGSHLGGGVRVRFGSRQSLYAELRRVIADDVNRTVFRIGGMLLFGDLYRAAPGVR